MYRVLSGAGKSFWAVPSSPNGQVIPSTGYRYSAGGGFDTAIANSTLPARPDGTYFTFE